MINNLHFKKEGYTLIKVRYSELVYVELKKRSMAMNNKRKRIQIVNEKVMISAIDIGKNKNTGYLRCYNGVEIKPFEFSNNKKGFKEFWEKIFRARVIHKIDKIIIGFESTSSYGEPLIHYLLDKPVQLVQVNPMHTKRVKELHDNSPLKTDTKDPKVIADIIQFGHYLSLVIPKGASAQLRRLNNCRERIIKNRTALINRLHSLVCAIFPEFLVIMKGIRSKTSLRFLKNYPTPDDIIKLGFESVGIELKNISRGKFGFDHAKRLFEAAKNSVGIKEGIESILMEIEYIIKEIHSQNQFIDQIEKKMKQYLKDIPYSRYLLSIKGIKEITVSGIIGEVGNFEDFHNQKAIIKLAGLNLYEVSSGEHKGKIQISKRGRSILRKTLFFASMNVIRKDGVMHDYYHNLINNGMLKKKALIAVSRKLLRLIFSLARNKRYYIHNYSLKSAA